MYVITKGTEKTRVADKTDALVVVGWLADLNCPEKVSFQPLKETEEDTEKEGE